MTEPDDYSVDAARAAAERDELDAWVAEFLASPGSDNAELGEALTGGSNLWIGPVQLRLDQLNRLAGPPGDPVLEAVDEDEWRDDVQELADDIDDGAKPPPVIVTYQDEQLKLEDGNHRVEALRRAGHDHAWAIVGFSDADERDQFIERSQIQAS